MTTDNQNNADTSPIAYIAFNVEKHGKKTYWTRIGVAFKPHEDGEGFTAKLGAIPLNGEIVFRTPKAAKQAGQDVQAEETGEEGA